MQSVYIGLTMTPRVGWKTIKALVEHQIDEEMFNRQGNEWSHRFPFLTQDQCQTLTTHFTYEKIQKWKTEWSKSGVRVITIEDIEYPDHLKHIYDPPWVLFTKGDLTLFQQPGIAFVGARKASAYGRTIADKLVGEMVKRNCSIISGMALGIDSISHWTVLKEGGSAIAVLGSGIDVIYPKQHQKLYHEIVKKGLVISEYPPGTQPHPSYFPRRNRIISGLSLGVVVVEATEQSGSLITAYLALEQGREVFAVPGSIFDSQSRGTNRLIQKHGAKLVLGVEDILEEFEHFSWSTTFESHDLRLNQEGIVDDQEGIVDDIEKKILELLQEKQHFNDLLKKAGLSISELSKRLLQLEMKGKLIALPGSYYHKSVTINKASGRFEQTQMLFDK